MDLNPENPFGDLMNKAVKLKTHQQAQLRTRFDSWPTYFQHSMFMQESVLSQRDKNFPDRIEAAEAMKSSGNDHFSKGDFDEAVAEYEKALAVFKYAENTDPGWKKKGIEDKDIHVVDFKCDDKNDQERLDSLKVACYLNIAVSKFKLKEYPTCIHACGDALEIEPKNVKALYRRALALITPASSGALEFERALDDLHKAYSINPENRDVRKMYRELREQQVKQKEFDRATFTGMFNRGEVYDDVDTSVKPKEDGPETEEEREERFRNEVLEAEDLARMCESKGHTEYASQIRGKIEEAKLARSRRRKEVDFFNPTQQMIDDAKKQGIDLADPQVQAMLHQLQEDERRKGTAKQEAGNGGVEDKQADDTAVESLLKSMTNTQIAQMLSREGIDYHSITDRDQFLETARQVLASKLTSSNKQESNRYFRTVCLFAVIWTLLRLYATGGLSVFYRLVKNAVQGTSTIEAAAAQDASDFFGD
ncbi:hypothetical protein Poli38472_000906 [Pythium oligandrum]|uniref:Uncharacterized protein n=1 Tax=Pythium oligandrum TaxID=41045 RepID=A0A8K1CCI0_PYTOL|nr:hypothetical protein Poli38472_000906 [Pythium oligandrum]|eukprot:TMW60864.1 hypothetical protein Poli38472_000906 [Pythium oligandrum]